MNKIILTCNHCHIAKKNTVKHKEMSVHIAGNKKHKFIHVLLGFFNLFASISTRKKSETGKKLGCLTLTNVH